MFSAYFIPTGTMQQAQAITLRLLQSDKPILSLPSVRGGKPGVIIETIDPRLKGILERRGVQPAGEELQDVADDPSIIPSKWKEIRKRPRGYRGTSAWERHAATPPFVARAVTPEDMIASMALKRANVEHDDALELISQRRMNEAVDQLRSALKKALLASRLATDAALTRLAQNATQRIHQSLKAFSRVTLAAT